MSNPSAGTLSDHATVFFDWVKTVNTPIQIVFACVVLAFLLAFTVRRPAVTHIFGGIAALVCVVLLYREIFPPPPVPPLNSPTKQTQVSVELLDEKDETKIVEGTVYLRTSNNGWMPQIGSRIVQFVLDEDNIPLDRSEFNAIGKASQYETSEKIPLKFRSDGSYFASITLTPRSESAKATAPVPPTNIPASSSLSSADVRGWKIDVFACSEHPDQSIPLATKLQKALSSKGCQNVGVKNWPTAGTASVRNGQTFYYALTSPLTINYTSSKLAQLNVLSKDISSIDWVGPLEKNEVGTAFSRYFSVVLCPGFTDADRYE